MGPPPASDIRLTGRLTTTALRFHFHGMTGPGTVRDRPRGDGMD
jgi:hypothetical protein